MQDTLIAGRWTGVGVGDFAPEIAEHLVRIGVAEPYETKVVETFEKKAPPSSASQAAQVSQPQTSKRRRGRPRKQSPSTTAGE